MIGIDGRCSDGISNRRSKLIRKWSRALDSNIGSTIDNVKDASKVAILIESEVKLNKGYLYNKAD
jgi:hypothetical protein